MDLILQVAAKALIINDDQQILIVRESSDHDTNTQRGKYGLPGGRLEPGEAFLDGLKRECEEETGLRVEPLYPLHVGEWRPKIKGIPYQVIAVFMACKAEDTATRLSDEHDDCLWIDPHEYKQYIFMEPDDLVIETYLQRIGH